jgi:rhodanese-related sulfurtransferase
MVERITREELRDLIATSDVTLVHALPEESFRKEHIAGAIQLDYDRVAEQAPHRLPDKDAAMVVYCASAACPYSEIAANKLAALGYADVREYAEGLADWSEAGLPLERDLEAAA